MPNWLKATLAVAAGGAVVIGAIIAFIFYLTMPLVAPVERQLAAIKAGDFEAAYAETSEAFRGATTFERFKAFVDEWPILRDHASYSFPNRSFENDTGAIAGSLTSPTGGVTPARYSLVKENGAWKVLALNLGSGT